MCYSALVKKDMTFLGQTYGATVIRDQVATFEHLNSIDPKRYPPLRRRIFPGHYAPVLAEEEGRRTIRLMRYGAYPPPHIPHPERYTTYNARRDNLTSPFWSDAYMKHHGFVVLEGMYEWVLVKDLLKAEVVSLDKVKHYFEKQTQARKEKILAEGKKYKPTPTELKNPLERRIIIEFRPQNQKLLQVPVIFSTYPSANGVDGWGFAIVTDEPPPEVEQAGHDRCPVILRQDGLSTWLAPSRHTVLETSKSLDLRDTILFDHDLEPGVG
jgi:putative SOS response-associated peptidase YedK